MCQPDQYIPRKCSEYFSQLSAGQARLSQLACDIDEKLNANTARLDELAKTATNHTAKLSAVNIAVDKLQDQQDSHNRTLERIISAGWRVAIIMVSIVASVLGLKNILGI